MFIDYIYLMLTIILICFIVFLIYLSYEYRQLDMPKESTYSSESSTSEETSNPTKCLEGFRIKRNPTTTLPKPTSRFRTILEPDVIPTVPLLTLPVLKKMKTPKFDLYNYNKLANKFDQSYNNINNEINNRDVTTDNIKNVKLFDKITKNLVNSQKLINIKNNLNKSLAPARYPLDKLIKTIKSKYNAQYISTVGFDKTKYSIIANDKCLTVDGLCKEPFCLLDCQKGLYSSDSQKFKTERIQNEVEAAKSMSTTLDKIATTNVYPFNVFKSLVNNNCLTLSNDGITVEDCNLNNIKQQWEISPDENICVLK
jgi:hypothetical protein